MSWPWIVDETNAATSGAIGTWWLFVATSVAAAATVAAVIAAFVVQVRQFRRDRREKEEGDLRRSRAAWVAVNQALTMLELLINTVRGNAEALVNWGFLRVGTRGAVAAANQALAQEIPNLDVLNLAIHAQTLAHSFNEDLERRAEETPVVAGEGYLEKITGLEQSLAEQRKVATRLKGVLAIDLS